MVTTDSANNVYVGDFGDNSEYKSLMAMALLLQNGGHQVHMMGNSTSLQA